jgi:LuxR family quorum sensing-dependent transcriptional regulator
MENSAVKKILCLWQKIIIGRFNKNIPPNPESHFEKNYFANDPAVLHLARTTDPFTWTDALACPDYTAAQRRVVYEAGEFDMHGGFVVPLVGLRTRTAVIELAGPNKSLGTRERAELQMASMAANSRLRGIFKPRRHPLPPLSNREREVLQWAAVGKSDWEIGEILSISEKMVNAHSRTSNANTASPAASTRSSRA